MKKEVILLLTSILILACGKSNDSEIIPLENTFVSKRDTQTWNGTTELGITANDTLVFLGLGDGLDNGVVVAKVKFEGARSYVLNDRQGIYYNTIGGDVLISQYAIEQGKEGIFIISTYDDDSKRIEGSFELPLKATRLSSASNRDSTLNITNGRFRGKIRDGIAH